jgi:predicted lipoprotein with Yx(FWY)xxD motif
MLKVGKWPLYRFAGDAAPGDTNGQGSGGVFFVVGADGKLIKA